MRETTAEQIHAQREYVTRAVALLTDNDEEMRERVILPAVADALRNGWGSPALTPEMLEETLKRSQWEIYDVIGLYVRDALQDSLEVWRDARNISRSEFWVTLLEELLDWSDREQWRMIGERVAPDVADMREMLETLEDDDL